ncbi:MAG TPA: hypothetical protein VMA33_06730, partial [Candidatus Tectomicrobia bacterium]|nr:hypothetical protein [Candidatus Tectomicrobia bacterium]
AHPWCTAAAFRCWSAARSDQATGDRDVDSAGSMHTHEVPPRRDKRSVDLISAVLPFGCLWYDTPDNAIGYAMHSSDTKP